MAQQRDPSTPPSRSARLGQPVRIDGDPWFGTYAERTHGLSESEVRALFAVASRPEVVSLAGGMPAVGALPEGLMAEIASHVLTAAGPVALQYGSGQGDPRLREAIGQVTAAEGLTSTADQVVVTTGSQPLAQRSRWRQDWRKSVGCSS